MSLGALARETFWQRTLDLAELARIERGDRVEVVYHPDSTQDLFERTLALVEGQAGPPQELPPPAVALEESSFVPENRDLRTIYLLAEALGGYDTLHDLINVYSPGNVLSREFQEKALRTALNEEEVLKLESFQSEVQVALGNAHQYLRDHALAAYSREELRQLYEVMITASERARQLDQIMGIHLIHEMEHAVQQLHEYHQKSRRVRNTIYGVFMVESEVMFIPPDELVHCVNTVFRGVGNAYLSRHIDGVLLLAARNLLIDVVSFYSYYGKQQIYNLFDKGGSTLSTQVISERIRREIRGLFAACTQDNRLMLRRVMKDAERQFELSVDGIQREAEHSAVAAVKQLMPNVPLAPPPARKSFIRRVLAWLGL